MNEWYNRYQSMKDLLTFQEYQSLTRIAIPVNEEVIIIFDEYLSEPEEVKAKESFDKYDIRKMKEELNPKSKSKDSKYDEAEYCLSDKLDGEIEMNKKSEELKLVETFLEEENSEAIIEDRIVKKEESLVGDL